MVASYITAALGPVILLSKSWSSTQTGQAGSFVPPRGFEPLNLPSEGSTVAKVTSRRRWDILNRTEINMVRACWFTINLYPNNVTFTRVYSSVWTVVTTVWLRFVLFSLASRVFQII